MADQRAEGPAPREALRPRDTDGHLVCDTPDPRQGLKAMLGDPTKRRRCTLPDSHPGAHSDGKTRWVANRIHTPNWERR